MLDLMGDVLCCFYLLKQADSAQQKWKPLLAEATSQAELLEQNEEAQFYWNKLRTTEFMFGVFYPVLCQMQKPLKTQTSHL
ncbi:MAG: hypothetical protein Ct9H300mP21_01320 [Pseudomonadota bacterium]|nr:MAG: hypothetical protein Ct9H300mP21_01320 [Pseudomonadota bacterium]